MLPRFQGASVSRIFVHFPDPWWKKRHHKRLVVGTPLLDEVARVLVPAGEVFVQTDVEERAGRLRSALRRAHRVRSERHRRARRGVPVRCAQPARAPCARRRPADFPTSVPSRVTSESRCRLRPVYKALGLVLKSSFDHAPRSLPRASRHRVLHVPGRPQSRPAPLRGKPIRSRSRHLALARG